MSCVSIAGGSDRRLGKIKMAGDAMSIGRPAKQRRLLGTTGHRPGTAVAEAATRGGLARVRDIALDRQWGARLVGVGNRDRRDQRLRIGMLWPPHDLVGRTILHDAAE